MTDITTKKELMKAIKTCAVVRAQLRFGCDETWVQIPKKEAIALVGRMNDDDTPERLEMYAASFGTIQDGTLYLG